MTPELLMCVAILAHPISGSPLYSAGEDVAAPMEKCAEGCYIFTQQELIAGLKRAHWAGQMSVVDEERRRGYVDGVLLGRKHKRTTP